MDWFLWKGLYLWEVCNSFLWKHRKHAAHSWVSFLQPAREGGKGWWVLCVGSPKGWKWNENPPLGLLRMTGMWQQSRGALVLPSCGPCLGTGCWRRRVVLLLCASSALGFHCCLFCHKAEMPVRCYCQFSEIQLLPAGVGSKHFFSLKFCVFCGMVLSV